MSTVCLSTNGTNHYALPEPAGTVFVATTDGLAELAREAAGNWAGN